MQTSYLFKHNVRIVDDVELRIPTLGEILDLGEEKYYGSIGAFIAQPFQYMAQLDDEGIDYEKISDFDLFIRLWPSIEPDITQFLFGDTLPLSDLKLARNNETGEMSLIDSPEDPRYVVNELVLRIIADHIRAIHFIKPETHKAGNEAAKEFLIERARKKLKRNQNKPFKSTLEPLIIALVNSPEFSYTYESARTLTIYQFMCSVLQIPRRIHYDKLLHGMYVGMIDNSKLDISKFDWMSPLEI